MEKVAAYAAQEKTSPLALLEIERREIRPNDIEIQILYCGVCHSDLHVVRNEWQNTIYPVVPGHEIIGTIANIGSNVKGFEKGEVVAVGCLVGSCGKCESCQDDLEQFCPDMILTYNSLDKKDGTINQGGYSKKIVVDKKFVLHVPKEFKEKDLPGVAPLLCAGITTYSPLRHWKIGKGSVVGVVGLGGLGHMAIKLAHAMGAEVILFTTSPGKAKDAKSLGADDVVISKNADEMKKYENKLDFIINTVSAAHNLDPYLQLLKRDGTLCLVGAPPTPHPSPTVQLMIFGRKKIGGSLIGGIKETQEMLDFCAKNHILSEVEVIPIQKINEAYDRLVKSDVKYRFVIDLASLK